MFPLHKIHCIHYYRRLEVQKVGRSVPTPVTTKRRADAAPSVGTKLPVVKRSRPPVTSGSDKKPPPTSLPQSSGNVGLSGNSGE